MKLLIRNGRLLDPANLLDGPRDLWIAAGKIVGVTFCGERLPNFTEERTIDAHNLHVLPGIVDLSARLREPGNAHKATLSSELRAAAAGGVTSLVCQPDTDPILDEPGLVEMLKQRAQRQSLAQVYPLGALTVGLEGKILTEMSGLADSGCIGFSQAEVPIQDTNILMRALQYANTFGYTVWLRPQDAFLGRGGIAHDGALSTRLGLAALPVAAETVALHTLLELVRVTGARVHLCRISSAAGLELVRAAKREGLSISCDVGIHHVHLTDQDIGYFDTNARLNPPLRSSRDRDAIRNALCDGTVDAICSDHTPVNDDEKLLSFGEASAGATALELLLALTHKWVNESHSQDLTLLRALSKITYDPARLTNINSGNLSVGESADICLFDPHRYWTVDEVNLFSQSKHTPFFGMELFGQVMMTFVAGNLIFERQLS